MGSKRIKMNLTPATINTLLTRIFASLENQFKRSPKIFKEVTEEK